MRVSLLLILLVLSALVLPGCEAIAGIFKAGMWTGIIAAIIIVALIGFIASRVRG